MFFSFQVLQKITQVADDFASFVLRSNTDGAQRL